MMMKAEEIGSCKHSTRLLLFFVGTYVCTQIISRARHVSRVPNGWTHYVPHKTPCVYNVTVVRFHPLFKCVCVSRRSSISSTQYICVLSRHTTHTQPNSISMIFVYIRYNPSFQGSPIAMTMNRLEIR